jgi:ATP-binding cassette, subfamily A (ABC1), member 3
VPWNKDYLGWDQPGIGRALTMLAVQAVVYWALIIMVEYNVFRNMKYFFNEQIAKCFKSSVNDNDGNVEKLDEDVLAERRRIETTSLVDLEKTDSLIIENLTKYYGTFCAVDHISYSVRRGECFGLLGINGAGKTSCFQMITGDETISNGNVFVNGISVRSDIQKVQQQIGYCPQFDGVIGELTGRETLTLFSRLRGVHETEIPNHILSLSKLLYFDMDLDKLVKNYSGGTKRKLSTAIVSLI